MKLKTRNCPRCDGAAFRQPSGEYYCPSCNHRFRVSWLPLKVAVMTFVITALGAGLIFLLLKLAR